jgi:hypothetical protein
MEAIASPEALAMEIGPSPAPPVSAGRRRSELIRQRREEAFSTARVVPGQLPTFERTYLIAELRQIAITSGLLLAIIVGLAIALR